MQMDCCLQQWLVAKTFNPEIAVTFTQLVRYPNDSLKTMLISSLQMADLKIINANLCDKVVSKCSSKKLLLLPSNYFCSQQENSFNNCITGWGSVYGLVWFWSVSIDSFDSFLSLIRFVSVRQERICFNIYVFAYCSKVTS